jgi:hypothetical protein
MGRLLLCGMLLLLGIHPAATAPDCITRATQELVAEILECTGYYLEVYSGMLATPGAAKEAEANKQISSEMFVLGTKLGSELLKISPEASGARALLHQKEMHKVLDGNTGNWPLLLLRYKDKCAALHRDVTPRQVELMQQECDAPEVGGGRRK